VSQRAGGADLAAVRSGEREADEDVSLGSDEHAGYGREARLQAIDDSLELGPRRGGRAERTRDATMLRPSAGRGPGALRVSGCDSAVTTDPGVAPGRP